MLFVTKICNRIGRNPLLGTGFDLNPIYNAASAVEESPKPKPRKSKSTFQSHITENWESQKVSR